jgi:hypothetical protein
LPRYDDPTKGAVMRVGREGGNPEHLLQLRGLDPNASFCAFQQTAWNGSLLIDRWWDGGDIYRLDLEMP